MNIYNSYFIFSLIISASTLAHSVSPMAIAYTSKTLADCNEELKEKDGGWCEMRVSDRTPSISSVWPSNEQLGKARSVTGPTSVLIAWNGAAFDKENNIFYFFGGGHADYGGNEVYSLDMNQGKWARLTDPSPLDHIQIYTTKPNKVICAVPDTNKVPFPAHTYSGTILYKNKLIIDSFGMGSVACYTDDTVEEKDTRVRKDSGIYAFDLKTYTWEKLRSKSYPYPRTVLINDEIYIGSADKLFYANYDGKDLVIKQQAYNHPPAGDGLAYFDKKRSILWELTNAYLWGTDVATGVSRYYKKFTISHGKSLAANNKGELISWNGKSLITSFDPDSEKWRFFDWKNLGGPLLGDSRVYTKWRYIEKLDLFVGISRHDTGVWVYKHPKNIKWRTLDAASPQPYIDNAAPGSTVTIPQGVYSKGFIVDKPLIVKMLGVELLNPIQRKGYIITQGGPITIDGFNISNKPNCNSNCAAIRLEKNPQVIIKNGIISNQENGILSGNDGGNVKLENITINNTNGGGRYGQQHSIYIGESDKFHADNITINGHEFGGHLVKSRAKDNLIINSKIDGLTSNHSRILDFPCGGNITLRNNILIQSPNSDNDDLFSISPENCGKGIHSIVNLTGNIIKSNKKNSEWANAKYNIIWNLTNNDIQGVVPQEWPTSLPEWKIEWNLNNNHIY